ncbi:3-oxoacid CoA-transferase subunit B [Thermodesulfobacteriota bacterium]
MKARLDPEVIAMRVAKEFQDGDYVNLGIGIGSLVASYIPPDKTIIIHSEQGILGFGRILTEGEEELADFNLINASGKFIAPKPGMCFFNHSDSFGMVRGGHIDITVLGALQVSERGDLANWSLDPEGKVGNIGGALDMPVGIKKVIVAMGHTTRNNQIKILKKCTLPLTCPRCVDLIVTDLAVIEVTPQGLVLKEVAPGWTEEEVQSLTEPKLILADDLKEMEL